MIVTIRRNESIMAKKTTKHPGFKAVQQKIAGEYGGDMEKAGAILASQTRKAKKIPRQ